MGQRNKRLGLIFLVLVVANVVFYFTNSFNSGVSFDERKFTLTDTTSIQHILIGDQMELSKTGAQWKINNQYTVDASLRVLLMSIMTHLQVKKPVNVAPQKGTQVQIDGAKPLNFTFWGNPTKTRTYFQEAGEDQVYEMQIPGYNEYLGSIFELTPDQWRNRLILDASWRTIQHLSLDYQQSDANDFQIDFDEDFFVIPGLARLDSNAVVEYLNQFQYFQINEWLSAAKFPKYDSLSETTPLAVLSLETLTAKEPYVLSVFPKIQGDRFYLVTMGNGSLMAIDEKRIGAILVKKNDFSWKE